MLHTVAAFILMQTDQQYSQVWLTLCFSHTHSTVPTSNKFWDFKIKVYQYQEAYLNHLIITFTSIHMLIHFGMKSYN